MNYCLGFLTDPSCERVLLMEKRRPSWQAGRLNGVGGKCEGAETGEAAMTRECLEETGLDVHDWAPLGAIAFEGGQVEVFHAVADIDRARATTDEPLRPVLLADAVHGRYPLVDDVQDILTKIQGLQAALWAPRRPHP